MSNTKHSSLWMIAVVALLIAIGYIALRPSLSAPQAPASAMQATPAAESNDPFSQPDAASSSDTSSIGDWLMEGVNPARTRDVAASIALPLTQQRIMASASFEDGVSPPVVSRGLMLVETKDALAAIDLRTGRQR